MTDQRTSLQQRIESGKPVLVAEIAPPCGADAEEVRGRARRYAGRVHALGVSDNRRDVRMAALAAGSLVASEGVEPILHVVTRDRNRIALVSEALGAQALGIRNLLCTSGTHQTLGAFRSAKNVFDVDSVQLLQIYGGLDGNGSVGGSLCLGAVASPCADPLELQAMRLGKKVAAGATYVITQPVFDLERFKAWWAEVARRGLCEKVAILAGVHPLASASQARGLAEGRPSAVIPEAILKRLASASDEAAQRAEGIAIAVETVEALKGVEGLRGFEIRGDGDDDAALEVIATSGLGME